MSQLTTGEKNSLNYYKCYLKTGHGPHSSKIVVLFYVLFVLYHSMYCLCANVYYCHRVTTQLQLTNISYHIMADKCDLCLRLTTWPPPCANCLEILVASTLSSPQGLFRHGWKFFPLTIVTQDADPIGRRAKVMGLQPLTVWNCGHETRRGMAVCLL